MTRTLIRWHIWLGWIVGVPLLFWTASGLFMVSQPIETVRGSHLRSETPALSAKKAVLPALHGRAIQNLELVEQGGRSLWIIHWHDGEKSRADSSNGNIMADVNAAEARKLAEESWTGTASFVSATQFSADDPPMDLRKARPSWQIVYDDGTHIYIDRITGETLALRTRFWRGFDLMWGLHIMDLQEREDTHHPILVIFAIIALVSVVIGGVLLFLREKRKKRKSRIFRKKSA